MGCRNRAHPGTAQVRPVSAANDPNLKDIVSVHEMLHVGAAVEVAVLGAEAIDGELGHPFAPALRRLGGARPALAEGLGWADWPTWCSPPSASSRMWW